MKKMIVLTNKYPNKYEKNTLVFVQQLIWEFANQNIDVTVIVPSPINIRPKLLKLPLYAEEKTDSGKIIKIYRPKYIGYGQSYILGFNPAKITTRNFTNSIMKLIIKKNIEFDVIYSHFITPAGIAAARLGKYFNKPSFMAHGEATTMTIDHFGKENVSEELQNLSGIIAVSTDNKNMLQHYLSLSNVNIEVFPNGFNSNRFHPKDKEEARKLFNLPKNKFIVSFVGSFDHRKGIKRLEQAVEQLDDVYFIAAGRGKLKPQSKKCLFYGQVSHEQLPYFYSASDVFVLPTLNEGSCNAIIEAIACGIPVISSDRSYNNDILDDSYSIKINPESVNEIKDAIIYVKNNKNRFDDFTTNTNNYSHQFDISTRAKKIINYIDERTNAYENKS